MRAWHTFQDEGKRKCKIVNSSDKDVAYFTGYLRRFIRDKLITSKAENDNQLFKSIYYLRNSNKFPSAIEEAILNQRAVAAIDASADKQCVVVA